VSSLAIGATVKILDTPTQAMLAKGIHHAIGSDAFPAPQGTLMATLINGILGFKLDWQFVLTGAGIAVVMELCGIQALSFAVGVYLPLSTTLPIFAGGAVRGIVDWQKKRKGEVIMAEAGEEDLGKGNLFATGLIAGGAIAGVLIAFLSANERANNALAKVSTQGFLTRLFGEQGYMLLGAAFFVAMAVVLYRVAIRKDKVV
jgi:uncharacterized oligopeptide transporter (OPT) family protein